jgi:uncharacterized membrane protein HdeD (DUF308 family)
MIRSTLFRTWWVILIQGILTIILSIIIFNNPDAVLATMALYLGAVVIIAGIVGVIAYFSNSNEKKDIFTLLGSAAIVIIGILMISKLLVTIKAITLVFGLLVAVVGWVLITGSWSGRKQWSLWWIIALLGAGALITGIKSILNIYSGAESISNLIGIAVLISGIGLICLAILKKKIVSVIKQQ